jgi:hypothetical protein
MRRTSASIERCGGQTKVLVMHVIIPVIFVVIPIPLVFLAPAPVGIHPRDIVIDLAAVFAVASDVTVDPRPVRFQSSFTRMMLVVCPGNTGRSQR